MKPEGAKTLHYVFGAPTALRLPPLDSHLCAWGSVVRRSLCLRTRRAGAQPSPSLFDGTGTWIVSRPFSRQGGSRFHLAVEFLPACTGARKEHGRLRACAAVLRPASAAASAACRRRCSAPAGALGSRPRKEPTLTSVCLTVRTRCPLILGVFTEVLFVQTPLFRGTS